MQKPVRMELTVKSFTGAKIIARAIGTYCPRAADAYMDKFHLRRSIESAAVTDLYTVR